MKTRLRVGIVKNKSKVNKRFWMNLILNQTVKKEWIGFKSWNMIKQLNLQYKF